MWNLTEQQQYNTWSCPCAHHEGIQDLGKWSAIHFSNFNYGKWAPSTHWTGEWMGTRVGMDSVVKRKYWFKE